MIFQTSFYKSKKLLLIEDCEPVRASIKGMLQQIGFDDITAVADAMQAISPARRHSFDFILADFNLGDGKDALQLFNELSALGAIKTACCFVLMSTEPQRLPMFGVLQGTPDHFVLKPFSYVELEKRLAKAWQNRTALRKVYQAIKQADLANALLELDEALKAGSANPLQALRLKGELLLAQGEYNAAAQLYSKIKQQRDFSWARLGAAATMVKLQQWDNAEQLLLQLAEQDDIRPEAIEWLARCYLLQADLAKAQEQLTELLKLQPTNMAAHYALADVLQLNGQQEDSSKYLQKLVQQFRFSAFDAPDCYLQLSRLLLEQAQYTELAAFTGALKKSSEALANMPQKLVTDIIEPEIAVLRARISLLQGNVADARQQLNLVTVASKPVHVGAELDKARLAFALGDTKQAEAHLAVLKSADFAADDLSGCCQRLLAKQAVLRETELRAQLRDLNQAGMDAVQKGNVKAALVKLRQAFLLMPCNAGLALNLLQVLGQLPAHKALLPLAKAVLSALENTALTHANQQRLAQLLPQLPELYLD
ncbi:tetratricopeptide repeat protein [Rheinheimera oceanensis]|uniref:tetratricopeptide repeat protein n=1 Tax=Rheinheimera oceanensis TaxID=2817449 RepID=UPI001BFE9234|nr:tetratricopeptide repeat protein [Rheinheimera oceanensis]